ncbi:MAG TPA: NHL repeat-containing protein, partial [Solirubrobacterales bacterium]
MAFSTGLIAVLLTLPAAALGAGPTALWQRCDDSAGDLSCSLPRGIGVSPVSGHLYVADNARSRIDEYTAWGEFMRSWGWGVADGAEEAQVCTLASVCKAGIQGGHSGQLGGLQGIAVDTAGNLYVAEFANHRVQKFDPEGHFLLMFGAKVNKTKVEEGKSAEEQNLCTALSGNVCQAGVEGSGPSEFGQGVTGGFIATGSTSNNVVYVGDNGKVEVFNPDGTFKEFFPDPDGIIAAGGRVQSLVPATNNGLFLVFNEKSNVIKLTSAGKKSCSVNEANPAAELAKPRALAIAVNAEGKPTSSLYVYDETDNEVRQFNSACGEKENFLGEKESFANGDATASTGLAAS